MNFYRHHILPWLTRLTIGSQKLHAYRQRVVSGARRTVLEIGISGQNLAFYRSGAKRVIGLDPSPVLLELARKASRNVDIPIELLEGSADSIPLANDSVDTVVMTWTLCSVPDVAPALAEMRRVLSPGGRLLFVEHGLPPETRVQRWQHRLDPFWWQVSCHLNRPMNRLIEHAGFHIEKLDMGHMGRGPKTMTFMYEGEATPRQTSIDNSASTVP